MSYHGINPCKFNPSQCTQSLASQILPLPHPAAWLTHIIELKTAFRQSFGPIISLHGKCRGKCLGWQDFQPLGNPNPDRHQDCSQAFFGGEGSNRQPLSLVIANAPCRAPPAELGLPSYSCTLIFLQSRQMDQTGLPWVFSRDIGAHRQSLGTNRAPQLFCALWPSDEPFLRIRSLTA